MFERNKKISISIERTLTMQVVEIITTLKMKFKGALLLFSRPPTTCQKRIE